MLSLPRMDILDSFIAGKPIQFKKSDRNYFFSCVKKIDGQLVTAGGRVLGAFGKGSTFEIAREDAYFNLHQVQFDGMQYRSDIGLL